MKKLISILLVMLLALTFVACDEQNEKDSQNGDGTTITTGTPDSTGNPSDTSGNGDSTGGDTSSGDNLQTNPSDDNKPAEKIKANVFHQDHYYEFAWEETDGTNGVLTIAEYMTATADEMAGMGLSGALTYKQNILTYNVTYSQGADGVYIAEGAVVSVASAVEGESATAFIQMMKEGLGDSQLDILTGRALEGEALTAKDDIENFLMRNDCTVKVSFSIKDGKMVVSEYETNYIVWGPLVPIKEVCYIQNDVVRTYEKHYDGALDSITAYRENGIIEKCDTYYEGKISYTVNYDENGDEIGN